MRRIACVLFLAFLWVASARADAPSRIPVQGLLTDSSGQAVEGTVSVTFGIYDSAVGGILYWSETQEVTTERGLFSVYLGDVVDLNLAMFKGRDDLWLGLQVDDDPEMARIYLGATPFAAYAQHGSYTQGAGITIGPSNVVSSTLGDSISGDEIEDATIQFANLAQNGCTIDQVIRWNGSAWVCSSISSVIPAGAVMTFNLASCPEGWSELAEARGRFVMGLPAAGTLAGIQGTALGDLETRTISDVPAHTHPVDPPAAATDSTAGHSHGVNDPGHSHTFQTTGPASGTRAHFAGSALVNAQTSTDATGVSIQQAGGHSHTVDPDSFTSGSAGQASVDVTMPYIQLLVCRKN